MDRIIVHKIEKEALLRDFLRSRYSGRRIHYLREDGRMKVNGAPVTVNFRLHPGDELTLSFCETETFDYPPQDMGLKPVYEDEDVLVVYKPAGVPSMPAAPHFDKNLFNGLKFLYPQGVFRVVTRLDKDTSGLVLVAKNALSHSILYEEIRTVQKTYTALSEGCPDGPFTVELPVGDGEGAARVSSEDGKPAITHVIAVKRLAEGSLLTIRTETGRTHQIRLHLSKVGYPLVGDALYGSKTGGGQLLACTGISFSHPITREKLDFFMDGEREILDRFKNFTKLSQK